MYVYTLTTCCAVLGLGAHGRIGVDVGHGGNPELNAKYQPTYVQYIVNFWNHIKRWTEHSQFEIL